MDKTMVLLTKLWYYTANYGTYINKGGKKNMINYKKTKKL